jgi:hypothetical protein
MLMPSLRRAFCQPNFNLEHYFWSSPIAIDRISTSEVLCDAAGCGVRQICLEVIE